MIKAFILLASLFMSIRADAPFMNKDESIENQSIPAQNNEEIYIPFSLNNEPLTNIVNGLMKLKKLNIIEPQDDNYKKLTVTFPQADLIPLDEAWNLLQTFLKLGGYTLVMRGDQYTIIPALDSAGKPNFQKEILPLYINVEPDNLPRTDAPIRAMFFLENLNLQPPSSSTSGSTDIVGTILKDMLSKDSMYILDPNTKSIILTDSANIIASAMKIIYTLDRGGMKETIEIVPLYNTTASTIAVFLQNGLGIKGAESQPAYLGTTKKSEGTPYFSPNTAIVSDDRMNALILLGRQAQVDRLRTFIEEYIDVPADKGETILHTYDLQYLDSEEIAGMLSNLFKGPATTTGQSKATATMTGPERYFQNPVIVAETLKQVTDISNITSSTTSSIKPSVTGFGGANPLKPYIGGNRLIIAALKPDWQRIHDLIKKIDVPQRNIIIEAMIVDLSFADDRFLRGAIRNPKAMGLQDGQSFQAQNIPTIPTDSLVYDATGTAPDLTLSGDLQVDMLKLLAQSPSNTIVSDNTNFPFVAAFKDPTGSTGIWGVLEIFNRNSDFKILQHPSVVVSNNNTATIAFQEIRRDFGTVASGSGGALTVPIVDVTAQIAVTVTPRTSSNDRVNLTLTVEISDFPTTASNDPSSKSFQASFDRRSRALGTNVNMSNNQVLALGGLVSSTTNTGETRTPILSRIPLIGAFFRGTTKTETKTNLVILLSTRIVEPHGRTHTLQYTKDKVAREIYHFDDQELFSALKDPITRVFFKREWDEKLVINDFFLETEGTMLKPEMYQHEPCNDAKISAKIGQMEEEKFKAECKEQAEKNEQLYKEYQDYMEAKQQQTASGYPPQTNTAGPAEQFDEVNQNNKLKYMLAETENPLTALNTVNR